MNKILLTRHRRNDPVFRQLMRKITENKINYNSEKQHCSVELLAIPALLEIRSLRQVLVYAITSQKTDWHIVLEASPKSTKTFCLLIMVLYIMKT